MSRTERDRCGWPGCKSTRIEVIYIKVPLCEKHWEKGSELPNTALKQKLGIVTDRGDNRDAASDTEP